MRARAGPLLGGHSPSPEELVAEKESIEYWKESIKEAIQILDDREKYVIRMHLFSRESVTLKYLGNHLGLSGERVRQIEKHALVKIRQYLKICCGLSREDLPDFSSIHFDTEEAEEEYSASGFFMKRGPKAVA